MTGVKEDAIARVLGISLRSVQKHVSEADRVLGARTRSQIALRTTEQGLLPPTAPAPDRWGRAESTVSWTVAQSRSRSRCSAAASTSR
ncbi:hypothetical protein ABZX30_35080, partial [Streptomyces sp. NPDC004542]